jgi:hypothetical protein
MLPPKYVETDHRLAGDRQDMRVQVTTVFASRSGLVEAMGLQDRFFPRLWRSPPMTRSQTGANREAEKRQTQCQLESIPSIA